MLSKIRIRVSSYSFLCLFSLFMSCVKLFDYFRVFSSWLCESCTDCFPERLTVALTKLEIVYYCIACLYFFVELVLLLVSVFK